jgi:hypothetical protein
MSDELTLAATIFAVCAGLVLLFQSVRDVQAEEAAELGEGWFRPVGVAKFVLLSTVSVGLYTLYWFWRCWRRYRITEQADIRPFWRTFFMVFWIVTLFSLANEKTEKKWPIWIAMLSTALYFVSYVTAQVGTNQNAPFWQTEAIGSISTLALVPIVMQINRINAPEFLAHRERFSKRDWIALAFGAPFWLALMVAG